MATLFFNGFDGKTADESEDAIMKQNLGHRLPCSGDSGSFAVMKCAVAGSAGLE